MYYQKTTLPVIVIFLLSLICIGCHSQSLGDSSRGTKSADPVGAYSGRAEVSSVLDLPKGQQEIGVELPDGRTTSVRLTEVVPVSLGQKVKVTRHKNGSGSVTL